MATETTDRERVRYKALEEDTMCGAFQVTAAERADAVAIRTKGDELTITWGEYADRVKKLAAGLAELAGGGIQVADAVLDEVMDVVLVERLAHGSRVLRVECADGVRRVGGCQVSHGC